MKIDADDLNFLRQMASDVVEASRVHPGQRVAASPPNTLGHTVIRPGGRECYPAVWVRDFSMSLDSGLISPDEVLAHFRLFASKQNGASARTLKSGAVIPPFAIPDHINFDGGAVFYPGTYSAGEDQGGEPFGILPPVDDHFEFIHVAHHLWKLGQPQDVQPLLRAFDATEFDPATGGMVATTENRRAVGFGFCDAVFLTGSLLFPSLLRYRAAMELTDMRARDLSAAAASIQAHLVPVFADAHGQTGWFYAATGIGRQPDVWGTLYALHLKLLPDDFAHRARETVADAVKRKTITYQGAVRHVPTDFDACSTSSWEKVVPGVAINTYQNGAYWHTPTGWLVSALHESHPELAEDIFHQYIAHLRQQDFRRGDKFPAPWECFGKNGRGAQNPVYMTSVTLPYSVIQHLEG